MKIVIQQDIPCCFMSSISKIMSAIGNQVIMWNSKQKNIYEMRDQIKPDLLFVSNISSIKHWDAIKEINYVTYGIIDPIGKAIGHIPLFDNTQEGFIDKLMYNSIIEDHMMGSDILISTNYLQGNEELLLFMENIFQNTSLKIKATGNSLLPSPYFVGVSNEVDFMNIAKASKLVIASNPIEKYSLLYNKIYSCMIEEVNQDIIHSVTEEKLRRKYLKENRKKLEKERTSEQLTMKLFEMLKLQEQADKIRNIVGKI